MRRRIAFAGGTLLVACALAHRDGPVPGRRAPRAVRPETIEPEARTGSAPAAGVAPAREAPVSGVVLLPDRTPAAVVAVQAGPESALTDEAGRFSFESVPDGEYRLVARRPGFVDAAAGPFAGGRIGVVLVLGEGTAVAGRVIDESGIGVGGAVVESWRADEPSRREHARTDDLGFYRLAGLATGTLLLCAGDETQTMELTCEGTWPVPDLVIRKKISVSGLVVDPDGGPVIGARVVVLGAGGRAVETRTDREGRFRAGRGLVVALARGRRPAIARCDGEPVRLVLAPGDDAVTLAVPPDADPGRVIAGVPAEPAGFRLVTLRATTRGLSVDEPFSVASHAPRR